MPSGTPVPPTPIRRICVAPSDSRADQTTSDRCSGSAAIRPEIQSQRQPLRRNQQRRTQRLSYRIVPGRRLEVPESVLKVDRSSPLVNRRRRISLEPRVKRGCCQLHNVIEFVRTPQHVAVDLLAHLFEILSLFSSLDEPLLTAERKRSPVMPDSSNKCVLAVRLLHGEQFVPHAHPHFDHPYIHAHQAHQPRHRLGDRAHGLMNSVHRLPRFGDPALHRASVDDEHQIVEIGEVVIEVIAADSGSACEVFSVDLCCALVHSSSVVVLTESQPDMPRHVDYVSRSWHYPHQTLSTRYGALRGWRRLDGVNVK